MLKHFARRAAVLAASLLALTPVPAATQRVSRGVAGITRAAPVASAAVSRSAGAHSSLGAAAVPVDDRRPTIIGAVTGAVLGGLAGHQIAVGGCEGPCRGSATGPTLAGAAVGALLGYGLVALFRR